jgi:hypothetical protein
MKKKEEEKDEEEETRDHMYETFEDIILDEALLTFPVKHIHLGEMSTNLTALPRLRRDCLRCSSAIVYVN